MGEEGEDYLHGGELLFGRQSQDAKPDNHRGRALDRACTRHAYVALNGRCQGDPHGSATYTHGNTRSVLDFALVPHGACADMIVHQLCTRKSDHHALLGSLYPTLSAAT